MSEPKATRGTTARRWSDPIPDELTTRFEAAGLVIRDHDSEVFARRGDDGAGVGSVWGPAIGGDWFAYRQGENAVRVPTRDDGLRHILGAYHPEAVA